jgi:hyaluronate lyase
MKGTYVMNSINEYDILRSRWRDALTGGELYDLNDPDLRRILQSTDSVAQEYWDTMEKNENRTCLWKNLPSPKDVYRRDFICQKSYDRIEKMVLAFSTKGCSLEGNEQLKNDIITAMEFIYHNWYNEDIRKGGEWWHKEIGLPLCINKCTVMMYDHLSEKQIANYMKVVASFTDNPIMMCIDDVPEVSTGANRAWKSLALAGCGIITKDCKKLSSATSAIREVFQYTESKDGFYKDGSFVQHLKFAYTGGYGISLLKTIVDIIDLLRDTLWEIDSQEINIVLDWVSNSYEPLIYKGGFMSMTRGREIARDYCEEHIVGHNVIQTLVKLTQSMKDEKAVRLKSKIKYWINCDTYRNFFKNAPINISHLAKEIIKDQGIVSYDETPSSKIFACMDRVVHRRKDYTLGISMSSRRIGKYESIHDENVRGWYTSDGMTYLYNSDLAQYSEGFFPTVNAYRMPGTTIDTLTRLEEGVSYGNEAPLHNDWVGGSQLDDLYGVVGMDLEAYSSNLEAKKSWFLFDDEIVCLGAGITCTENRKVETIVENRKINQKGDKSLTVNGILQDFSEEKTINNKNTKYIHLHGNITGSDIGYYFPEAHLIEIFKESRTDSWKSINKHSSPDTEITNNFINILINHGTNPKNDTYQYVLLPNKNLQQLQMYAKEPMVEIIENTSEAQAVRQKELNITGVNFWKDDVKKVGDITCNRKASIIIQEANNSIALAVSDPTQRNEQGILVELNKYSTGILACDSEIKVIQLKPTVKLEIVTKNAMGKSVQIQLLIDDNLGEGNSQNGSR